MLTETAEVVLKRRYYLENEHSWEQLCKRVALAVAAPEVDHDRADYAYWFHGMIHNLDFVPNSPCLMNAGTDNQQLSACFVLPVEDSMDGIFTTIRNGALVHKTGGGTGYSFSRLRPKNSPVLSTQGVASGPLSFMGVFDAATETIKQGGKRRGANMGVLRVDHPDILDFIQAKTDQEMLNNFNLSIALTDAFMDAALTGEPYPLIDPRDGSTVGSLNAGEVFNDIVHHAWDTGEPGVLFIDAANRDNPTPHLGEFEATNPCGEAWLLPYESCTLGSINLSNFVTEGSIDYEGLAETVRLAIRFLDNVIEVNDYPIPEIEEATKKTRKIGLGIMGLHDMLIQLGLPYESEEGRDAATEVMGFIKKQAYSRSCELGREKGICSAFSDYDSPPFPQGRNAALTSIQPTGTVSMIADCSSGCEPYFSIVTEKTVMDGDKFTMVNKHFEWIAKEEGWYSEELMTRVKESGSVLGHDRIPEKWQQVFKTAQDIAPEDHIKMQIALQSSGVDASISKTINLPSTATEEDVRAAYIQAWKGGCKGLTVYRDGSRQNQVLTKVTQVVNAGAVAGRKLREGLMQVHPVKKSLPDVLDSKRYRLKGKDDEQIYIIICHDEGTPVEVFAKFPHENRQDLSDKATMWTTTCRLVSQALRFNVPVEEVVRQLDQSSGSMFDLPGQLSKLLKQFGQVMEPCPECEKGEVTFEEGCQICKTCGWSKCL